MRQPPEHRPVGFLAVGDRLVLVLVEVVVGGVGQPEQLGVEQARGARGERPVARRAAALLLVAVQREQLGEVRREVLGDADLQRAADRLDPGDRRHQPVRVQQCAECRVGVLGHLAQQFTALPGRIDALEVQFLHGRDGRGAQRRPVRDPQSQDHRRLDLLRAGVLRRARPLWMIASLAHGATVRPFGRPITGLFRLPYAFSPSLLRLLPGAPPRASVRRRRTARRMGAMANIDEYGGGQRPDAQVLVVTTNDIPGYRVDHVIGEVFGLTVRSRHIGSQIGASLKSLVGGELRGLTKTLVESRNEAMERLVEQTKARGGNAVLMFRFDVTEAADAGTEVCAYGTAVVISPATA